MGFTNFLKKFKKPHPKKDETSNWVKCPACGAIIFYKEVQKQNNTCPKCGYHFRMNAVDRINLLADEGTFIEYDKNLKPNDPLNFVDKKSYKKRIEENSKKTGNYSSVISGECKINSILTQLVVFDFNFMGGSLGSVEGEKIVRAVKRAIEKKMRSYNCFNKWRS
jgi:acetyl-CoA carboxylase carboxyl transferase subunit beta